LIQRKRTSRTRIGEFPQHRCAESGAPAQGRNNILKTLQKKNECIDIPGFSGVCGCVTLLQYKVRH